MILLDAHVHVWDPATLDYPWLKGLDALDAAFLPDGVDRADGATTGMVFVQADCRADQSLAEARWVAGLAVTGAWPELQAIVAAADLRGEDDLLARLDALASVTRDSGVRVAGVRHLLQDEPDDALSGTKADALVAGLRVVADRGLTFDVCVRHPQLATVVGILERIPEARTVLDHVGKPPVAEGIDSEAGSAWADAVARLARLPNAHVKLSGLAAEASSAAELDVHAGGFLEHAIRARGPDRCMIGSDWPVSAVTGAGGTLARWRERVRAAATAAGVGSDGIREIEAGTVTRFYGL